MRVVRCFYWPNMALSSLIRPMLCLFEEVKLKVGTLFLFCIQQNSVRVVSSLARQLSLVKKCSERTTALTLPPICILETLLLVRKHFSCSVCHPVTVIYFEVTTPVTFLFLFIQILLFIYCSILVVKIVCFGLYQYFYNKLRIVLIFK